METIKSMGEIFWKHMQQHRRLRLQDCCGKGLGGSSNGRVDCAYFNAPLKDPVYMQILKRVDLNQKTRSGIKTSESTTYIYGLKQAGNEWAKFLKNLFKQQLNLISYGVIKSLLEFLQRIARM